MMRTDLSLDAAVRGALRTELGGTAAEILVSAKDGVVRLGGVVRTAEDKLAAERAVQRVPGVHAVVEALEIAAKRTSATTDEALAQDAVQALATGVHSIGQDVTIKVENGWLTLGGTVASAVEYAAVERALECLDGARGITSEVRIAGPDTGCASCRVAPSTT